MYTAWCLTLYHNPIYCWALSIYTYFNLIQCQSIIAIHYCHTFAFVHLVDNPVLL